MLLPGDGRGSHRVAPLPRERNALPLTEGDLLIPIHESGWLALGHSSAFQPTTGWSQPKVHCILNRQAIYAFYHTQNTMTIEEDVDSDTPCPTQREGNLSNELRRMILSQQSHPQVVAPPPMFNDAAKASSNENLDPKAGHPRAASAAPLFSFSTASQLTQGRKTQNASQFLGSQDFVTPADQFDAEYDVMNCSQRAAGTLVRQRSPAAMSPMRMKRVNRMTSPGRSVLGKGAVGTVGAAGTAGAAGPGGVGGTVKGRVAPCYRSAFSDRVEEERGLAGWSEAGKEVAIERPVISSGSRYRDDFKETGMLGQVRCHVIACIRCCRHCFVASSAALARSKRLTVTAIVCRISRGPFVRSTALVISWTVKCMRSSERFVA